MTAKQIVWQLQPLVGLMIARLLTPSSKNDMVLAL
jgi:hypothetical protein